MKSENSVETKMQNCLDRLGLPHKVLWMPEASSARHGEIKSNCIIIYDLEEAEAWLTFEHEVYEYKFKEVTQPYRTLVNNLIEAVEKLVYERKEKFIEALPKVSEIIFQESAKKVKARKDIKDKK